MFVKYYFTFIVNFFMKASIRRSVPKRKKQAPAEKRVPVKIGSALAELRSTTCGLEAVLEQNQTLYPLILLGFQALGFPVSPFVN